MRSESGEPVEAQGLRLTHEFFRVFRVTPVLGRAFTAEDEIDGRHRVAILSHGYWQRRYGGSPDAIGQRIEFNDQSFEIVWYASAVVRTFLFETEPNDVGTIVVGARGAHRGRPSGQRGPRAAGGVGRSADRAAARVSCY